MKPSFSRNDTIPIPSRSSSVSSISSSMLSRSKSQSTNSSFSNLSLQGSIQNINLTQPTNMHTDDAKSESIDVEPTTKRRSSRIKRKRELGFKTYYTPKQWEPFVQYPGSNQPPLKKRKTAQNGNKKVRKSSRSNNKPKQTYIDTISDSEDEIYIPSKPLKPLSITKKPKNVSHKKTISQLLSAQNTKMKKTQKILNGLQINWLKHNFSAFEPFLSRKVRRRLRPKAEQKLPPLIHSTDYVEQPDILCSGTLRDYQLKSVNWLRSLRNNGVPAILADEMGLGKTIQSISTVASFLNDSKILNQLHQNNQKSPSIVICPLSVSEAWLSEFNKWMPSLRCVLFHGPKLQRERMKEYKLVFGEFDIVITTYEIATNNKSFLAKFMFNYFILDEAHKIKNEDTNWHNALRHLRQRSLHSVLLTGTPIQNNMHELYALLSFMFDDVFDEESAHIFDSAYIQSTNEQNKALLSKAPYLLNPFFLRRLKSEVELSLPPKEEIIIKIKMSKEQKKYYKGRLLANSALIDAVSDTLYDGDRKKAANNVSAWRKMRHLYTELRKIALHPFLLETNESKLDSANGKELISHSSKLQLLDKLLHRLKNGNHRVLIFSCFVLVLNLLQLYCEYKGYKYLRLDGSTSRIRRKIDIMRFNEDPNSEFFIYLISNRAGGLGINLQSADTVIHFDTDWNPQADLQAQARAHRIGQKKMVKIYRLITKDTVEERILFRSQQKLYLDAVVNKGAKMLQDCDGIDFDLTNTDLLHSIKFGAQKMFDSAQENENADDIDLDILLQRGSYKISDVNSDLTEEKQREKLLKDLSEENNVRDFNFSMKLTAGNVFEGTTYEKKQCEDEIDYNLCKRVGTKTKLKTMIVDGLRFTTRIEENKNANFYKQCSNFIYDSRNNIPFKHELERCWHCDEKYTALELLKCDKKIVKCQRCPKTFCKKRSCMQQIQKTNMGYLCGQHLCHLCGAKTSECGMILRCLGCELSYCFDCLPAPCWKDQNGVRFVDECKIAQHFGFILPQSQYMYIFCSRQCEKWYNTDYKARVLPDLSMKYDDLPNAMKERMSMSNNERMKLSEIVIDERITSYDMPCQIIPRLQQNIDGDSVLIERFYDILYLYGMRNENQNNEEKEDKEYIKSKHYLQIKEINQFANEHLTLPQYIQCTQCQKMRIVQIRLDEIPNAQWKKMSKYSDWKCCHEDGFEKMCDSVQENVQFSEIEKVVLKMQNDEEKEYDQSRIYALLKKYKLKSFGASMYQMIEKKHLSQARFIGIGDWMGYKFNANDEKGICMFYEHLFDSFRHWRMESLKTLMDHLGFIVVSKKKERGGGYITDYIAMSYNKDKVIEALATFLCFPSAELLELTTSDFSK